MIYLDNAATTYHKPKSVIDAVNDYLLHPGNPGRGSHETSLSASRLVLETRMKICDFFDGDSLEHVIFTSGITESLNITINGLLNKGDHVITTYLEHNSVLRPLYRLQEEGLIELTILYELKDLEKVIQNNTKMVIINHASNVTGEIQDINYVGDLCHLHNICFILDAGQSAGIIDISMRKSHIDVLCFAGHKELLGIQGIGGLVIQGNLRMKPFKVGGTGVKSFEKKQPDEYPLALEAGTLNVPGIVSLNASIDYIQGIGLKKIYQHVLMLRNVLVEGLSKIGGIEIIGNGKDSVGIVSINTENNTKLCDILSHEYEIETRCGAHCAPLVHEYYHLDSSLRFSISFANTLDEINKTIEIIEHLYR